MKSGSVINWMLVGLMLWGQTGCHHETKKPLHYIGEKKQLQYYKDQATSIAYTEVASCTPDEVKYTDEPRTIGERQNDEIWDMTLTEALHIALRNNRIIRTDGSFLNGTSALASQTAASVYDPAIQETGVLFGGRGIEAALSDFDAQFTTSMIWGRDENVVNSPFFGGTPGGTLVDETGTFQSAISKQFATGASFSLGHNWDYRGSNATGQLFNSAYTGNVTAGFRQPLWAGSGTEYTRIAGPTNPNFGAITGVSQGVLIARINNDLTVADFELAVIDLLVDVERLYWDLYLEYHRYHTAVTARNSALTTWKIAKNKELVGGFRGFKLADEAQARDRLFETRSQAAVSLSNLYTKEVRLRRLLGMAVNDGKIIRPVDEPVDAEFKPEWYASLAEGLTNRVELRKQKWTIRSLELQRRAAESLTNPQLDFVSAYNVNGFGDQLLGYNDTDSAGTAQGLRYGYETLTQGDQTGWNLGFEFSMPVGFRSARAQVRNYELRLAKARDQLAVQEQEVSAELAVAIQEVHKLYTAARENFSRRKAAQRRVDLYVAEVKADTATLDPLLRAQESLANAENAFYTSLVEYNLALLDLQLRKGTVLEYNNVFLSEGRWTPAAYQEALRHAWARTYALDNKHLHTEPGEFVFPEHCRRQPDLVRPAEENEEMDNLVAPESPEAPVEIPAEATPGAPTEIPPSSEEVVPQAPPATSLKFELSNPFESDTIEQVDFRGVLK